MVKVSKKAQISANAGDPSLEDIKAVLLKILPVEIVSEIIKVLPMYSPMTLNVFQYKFFN